MRVIIAGGRDFDDYPLLKEKCNYFLSKREGVIVISGGAKGTDALGERYAREMEFPVVVVPAEWARYGNSAGVLRNRQMAETADVLIAFWDGESPGTRNMIHEMKRIGKPLRIVRY